MKILGFRDRCIKFGLRTWPYLFNLLHNPDNSAAVSGALPSILIGTLSQELLNLFKTVQIPKTIRFTLRWSKLRRTEVSVSTLRNPTWQLPYQAAPIKFDPYEVVDRVRNAEAPIPSRLTELQTSADGRAERQALTDACNVWLIVQNENLKCPDCK